MSNTQLFLYILLIFVVFVFIAKYVTPHLRKRERESVEIHVPQLRPRVRLFDKNLPDPESEIVSYRKVGDQQVVFKLNGKYGGLYTKRYYISQLIPLDTLQFIGGKGAPVLTTVETYYKHTNYEPHLVKIMQDQRDAIKEKDHYRKNNRKIRSNIEYEVDQRVKQIERLQKGSRPDFNMGMMPKGGE